MKFVLMMLVSMNVAFAAEGSQLSLVKEIYSQKAFDVKIAEEKALMQLLGKNVSQKALPADSCVEWVYQGPASREEAIAACRGVMLVECAQWVYQGPASRVEAAQACRGVTDMACVEFAYRGPSSRVESAQACGLGRRPDRPRPPQCD